MPLARAPKRREDSVSAALSVLGEQQMMSAVLELPPRQSCKFKHVQSPLISHCTSFALEVLAGRVESG